MMACTLQVPQQGFGLAPPSLPKLPSVTHTTIVPFTDYSQWERRPQKSPEACKSKVKNATSSVKKIASSRHSGYCTSATEDTISARGRLANDRKKTGTGKMKQESLAKIRLLRMHLSAKRASVDEARHFRGELFSKNLSLMRQIQSAESSMHLEVDKMLDKYTKFKGTISRLKTKGSDDIERVREELVVLRAQSKEDVSELRKMVIAKEWLVQKKSRELDMLLSYKEKEYPLKAVKIDQLKEQCELMIENNDAEVEDLELQIAEEWEKCDKAMNTIKRDLETKATQASLATMKKSLHEKAIQNNIMEKEITIHQNKCSELQKEITELKSKIKRLSKHIEQRNESRHESPLAKLGKCLPNTELQLDFPRQQQFPF